MCVEFVYESMQITLLIPESGIILLEADPTVEITVEKII